MLNSIMWQTLKVLGDIIWDILYFPFWWFSAGLLELIVNLKKFIVEKEKNIGLLVWIINIFRPMYGQNDFVGSLISFIIRFFQIIYRGTLMIFWVALALATLCLWLILPFLVVYEIMLQLS